MKKILLLPVAVLGTLASVNAQPAGLQKSMPAEKVVKALPAPSVLKSDKLSNGTVEQLKQGADGIVYKGLVIPQANKSINPAAVRRNVAKVSDLPSGTVLFENFEEWDGSNANWLPDGWSRDRKVTQKGHPGWQVYSPNGDDAAQFLKSNALVFTYFDEPVDEWIITPEFEVGDGMILSWECFGGGPYYFDWDYMGLGGYFTEMVIINDLKVNITTDGGKTWNLLKSVASEIAGKSNNLFDLYYDYTTFLDFSVDLSEYAGSDVKIGFQVVGEPESQTTTLDNVKVGYPDLNLSYAKPTGSLYFGLTQYDDYLPGTFITAPVFQPVTFKNTSKATGATYWWTYDDADGEEVTVDDTNLTITYTTNHTSEKTSRNNTYRMPVLHATAPKAAETEFTHSNFLQAGGRAEYEIHYVDTDETEWLDLGMTVADPHTEGTRTYADISVPYFGYNQDSDRYWTEYTFGKGEGDENNWSKLIKFADYFYTPDAPLVIEGIRTNGYGQISRNTKFTAEVYFLNAAGVIPETPTYTLTCTGDDIFIYDRSDWGYINNFISLNFKFEEPIVISKSDCPAFVVAIGGFNDPENVEYFSPEMSEYDNPSKLGLGWVAKQMCWEGELMPVSWSSVLNQTEETERVGERYISFYIMLDAVYPWLEGDVEEINVGDDPVTVIFDSYYDGSEFEFSELPSWLEVKAEGRYDKTLVTFTAKGTGSAEVTLSAPAVSKTIKVTGTAGISDITADVSDGNDRMFNIAGQRVEGRPSPGLYIVRHADGTASKTIVK